MCFVVTHFFLLLIVLQQLIISSCNGGKESGEPTINLEPSVNAQYEGNSAVFNCTSYRYDYILWTLNDDPVTIDHLDLKPVNILDKKNLSIYSKLTVPGSLVYNNSRIVCTGVSLSRNTNQASNNGFLFVQGVPGKVINFKGANITDTQLKFSWHQPHHVQGIPPCCSNYSISITDNNGTLIINNNTITDTFAIINIHPKQLCSSYVIHVSAYNERGQGDTMTTKWSLGGYFEANEVSVILAYDEQSALSVGVNVTIDGYCINALNNITLFVQCDYTPGVLQKTHDIMASSTIKILHHYISLIIPESHHDRSCASEIALENEINLRGITFNTHDIQSVTVEVFPGSVCVECQFLPISPAKGCVLVLSPIGIDRYNKQFSINKYVPINESYGCLQQSTQGRYQVRVFDWQHDGQMSNDDVYFDIIDIKQSTTINPTASIGIEDSIDDANSNKVKIIVAITVPIIFILILLIIMTVLVIIGGYRNNRQPKTEHGTDETDGFEMKFLTVQLGQNDKVITDEQINKLQDIIGRKNIGQSFYKTGVVGSYKYHVLYSSN